MIEKEKANNLCKIAYSYGYICGTDDHPMKEKDWIAEFTSALEFAGYKDKGDKIEKEANKKMKEKCWHGNDIWVMITDVYDDIMESELL